MMRRETPQRQTRGGPQRPLWDRLRRCWKSPIRSSNLNPSAAGREGEGFSAVFLSVASRRGTTVSFYPLHGYPQTHIWYSIDHRKSGHTACSDDGVVVSRKMTHSYSTRWLPSLAAKETSPWRGPQGAPTKKHESKHWISNKTSQTP